MAYYQGYADSKSFIAELFDSLALPRFLNPAGNNGILQRLHNSVVKPSGPCASLKDKSLITFPILFLVVNLFRFSTSSKVVLMTWILIGS